MSFGVVRTRAFTEVENTPHEGHAAAVSSSVTTSTTRLPSDSRNTPVTFTPGNPNNTVVLSITPLVLPTSECFATSRLQETKGFQPIDALNTLRFQLARSTSKSRFRRSFVDGYDWVMVPNVVGMSQHADNGLMATKPYVAGGAYINRMSDYCGSCRYNPKQRVGDDACPFTAGYWAFLDRNAERLRGNNRMAQPLAGLKRLNNREEVVAQERERADGPP